MCGPDAFSIVEGSQRITEYRASSGLKSGSCSGVGATFAMIAFLNPAASNAFCHFSTPALHVRNPFGRRRAVDPVDDRLHRLGERGVGILLLQTPARDVRALSAPCSSRAVVDLAYREVADALVEQAAASSASRAASPCCSAGPRSRCRDACQR